MAYVIKSFLLQDTKFNIRRVVANVSSFSAIPKGTKGTRMNRRKRMKYVMKSFPLYNKIQSTKTTFVFLPSVKGGVRSFENHRVKARTQQDHFRVKMRSQQGHYMRQRANCGRVC